MAFFVVQKGVITLDHAGIQSYERVKEALASIDAESLNKAELKHVHTMINHCDYVVRWLRTGQQPPRMRDVTRLSYVQRELPCEYWRICQISELRPPADHNDRSMDVVGERVNEALSILSPKQRECFEMSVGQGMSFSEIAELTGVKKGTVQSYIETARKKLQQWREGSYAQ